ncbi:hypothetical protein GPK44_01150 [Bifidobacterium longum]|nr:hypothetical protein [Bifidobacterium longum]
MNANTKPMVSNTVEKMLMPFAAGTYATGKTIIRMIKGKRPKSIIQKPMFQHMLAALPGTAPPEMPRA